MSDKALELERYKKKMKFTRESFIAEITNFHEACINVGEKGLKAISKIDGLKPSLKTLHLFKDDRLAQIHKWFWDAL